MDTEDEGAKPDLFGGAISEREMAMPLMDLAVRINPETVDEEARTAELTWTTGAPVMRRDYWSGRKYEEQLVVEDGAVRMDRLNSGAPLLDSHSRYQASNVIGVVVDGSARLENGDGVATVRFSDRADVEPIWRDVMNGILRNISVGYMIHAVEITERDKEADLYRVIDWEPFEVSIVPVGADPGARVRSGADNRIEERVFPCVVHRADASLAQRAELEKGTMDPENEVGGAAANTEEQKRSEAEIEARATAKERQRSKDISDLCKRHKLPDDFARTLIEGGKGIDACRAAVLDEIAKGDDEGARKVEPSVTVQIDEREKFRSCVENALEHRHNPTVELKDGREYRGMSLLRIAEESLRAVGMNTRGMSRREMATAALSTRAGMHSGSDFPYILANVANKTLRAGYDRTQRTFTGWARRATITDFKIVSRAQLGGAPSLERIAEGGEYGYGSIGEGREQYQLVKYGKVLSITWEAIVNDDLDAFTRIPAAFGQAAADLESDIVYGALTANAALADGVALFHADHNNLAGTPSVIDEANLGVAYRAFAAQTGIEGRYTSILPQFCLVPPGQRSIEARKQVANTTPAGVAEVNTFAGRLQVVEEPRLIPDSGQDPWYLVADPTRIDTIEYAYLEGEDAVMTTTREGFDVDGLDIKAMHVFAAKPIDHRGMYKNAGAAPA